MDQLLDNAFFVPVIGAVASVIILLLFLSSIRPSKAPPNAHLGLPIIGTYIEFAKNPVNFITQCLKKFGPVYTVPMMHKKLTFVLGPEAAAPFF